MILGKILPNQIQKTKFLISPVFQDRCYNNMPGKF